MSRTAAPHDEVRGFVARVRAQLADLDAEEQQELVDGLEADLGELVAERGLEALGDPAEYARELRAAAGHSPFAGRARSPRRALAERWAGLLDATHHRWDRVLAQLPADVGGLLAAVRPAWWVLRAWIAVELVDVMWGSWPHSWIPSLFGVLGWAVTLAAIVVSVQVGRGRLWPGPAPRAGARTLLLALNLVAVVALVPVVSELPTGQNVADAYDQANAVDVGGGLRMGGEPVENVYPYDAQGHPLVGVQLVDQDGRRLTVSGYAESTSADTSNRLEPWQNGRTRVFSVFPLPEQTVDDISGDPIGSSALQVPPFASLPPVTLDGVTPSTLVDADEVAAQAREVRRLERKVRQQAAEIRRLRNR